MKKNSIIAVVLILLSFQLYAQQGIGMNEKQLRETYDTHPLELGFDNDGTKFYRIETPAYKLVFYMEHHDGIDICNISVFYPNSIDLLNKLVETYNETMTNTVLGTEWTKKHTNFSQVMKLMYFDNKECFVSSIVNYY